MRAHSKSSPSSASTLSPAAAVSESEKIVRHHVPTDRRMGLENPKHVMETQRIAQIEHEHCQINEQKYESHRISHFGHGSEDRRRRQLADHSGHEQSGRHTI